LFFFSSKQHRQRCRREQNEGDQIPNFRFHARLRLFIDFLRGFRGTKRADAKQEATIAKQQKQIDALAAGHQKVSAQLELSKPAPQVVNNP
jgi:hypothetical protein